MLQDLHVQKLGRIGFSRSDLRDDEDIEICFGEDEHGREISICI